MKKIIIAPLLIFALLTIPLLFTDKIFAKEQQSNEIKVLTSIEIDLTDINTRGRLTFNVSNTSKTNIITQYRFPNLWDFQAISKIDYDGSYKPAVKLDKEYVTLDFENQPLRPGKKTKIVVSFSAKAAAHLGKLYYWQTEAASLAEKPDTDIAIYTVSYPKKWGNLDYINQSSSNYEVKQGQESTTVNFKQIEHLELIWGQSLNINYNYVNLSEDGLVFLPRQTLGQRLKLENRELIDSIYRDESNNIFVDLKTMPDKERPFRIALSVLPQNKSDNKITQKYQLDDLLQFGKIKLPKNIHEEVDKINKKDSVYTNEKAKINKIIHEVSSQYEIKSFQQSNFGTNDNEINAKKEITYTQYLLLVNQALAETGVKNNIVLMDRRFVQRDFEFWLEVCDESCRYYSLEKNLPATANRQTSGLGIQLLAFNGINQLVFAKIRSLSSEYIDVANGDYVETLVDSSDEKGATDLSVKLEIPDEVKNFSNFTASAQITNLSQEPIFLQALVIENNTFPILDNALGGLHQGVLPGQTKNFKISNVFLPKFFIGMRKRSNYKVLLIYQKGPSAFEFKTEHSVLLKQNILFVILSLMGIFAVLAAIITMIMVYQHNRYVFIGAYWRVRRMIADIPWLVKTKLLR